jgi:uncharacterized protein YbaR (Trm112 family)
MEFDFQKVRDILACPKCKSALVLTDKALVCVNPDERLSFPILDGIPRLLVDEAKELTTEEWSRVMQSAEQTSSVETAD